MKTRSLSMLPRISALILIFIATHASAITRFTVNGQNEIELNFQELYRHSDEAFLIFEADVSQPGGILLFELYADVDRNGQFNPPVDAHIRTPVDLLAVVDGGHDFPGDQDRTINGQIVFEAHLANLLPGVPTMGIFIRAVDGDGSSATIVIRPVFPEFTESIAGRVSSENGEPIAGVGILAHRQAHPLIALPEVIDETFPVPEPDFFFMPLFTTTDADGNYRLQIEAGTITVHVLPRQGFYVPETEGFPFEPDLAAQQTVDVAPNDSRVGVDFVLAVDNIPPTTEHEPPQSAVVINSVVRLRAKITDQESGINRFGFEIFSSLGAMPTVFFRPAGTDMKFRRRSMYPAAVDVQPPVPIPLPRPALPDDPLIEAALFGEDVLVAEADGRSMEQGSDDDVVRSPDIGGLLPPGDFPQPEFYEAQLSRIDIGTTGVDYYIRASDRAGNSITHPIDAPVTLHHIGVRASDYIISGRIHTPDAVGIAGVTVFAHAFTHGQGEVHSTQTVSLGDGTYTLHLPAAGNWQISVMTPRRLLVLDPKSSSLVVEVIQVRTYNGNDFILVEDVEPPAIEHDPTKDVGDAIIGADLTIRATIRDDSGRVRAHLITLPIDREDGNGDEPHPLSFPYAIPSVGNETDWVFHLPGALIQGDFAYFIEAYDKVGNRATDPENPEENSHRVTVRPSPYRIMGSVTGTDGTPISEVQIAFSSEPLQPPEKIVKHAPSIRFRHTETGGDGRFDVAVIPGVWNVRVSQRGFAVGNPIEPIAIESEGIHTLNIILIADIEPPVIVHQPAAGYKFDTPMIAQAEVTDDHQVQSVVLRLFHKFDDHVVIFDEFGEIDVEVRETQEGDSAVQTDDVPPPLPDRVDEGGQADPGFPGILEPLFPTDIDFPTHLEPPHPGYFDFIPMDTVDGTTYSVNVRDYLQGRFTVDMDAISYVIQAIDAAGLQSISPENAPGESNDRLLPVALMHTVPLTIPQTVSGTVTTDGKSLAGVTVHLTDRETVKLRVLTDAKGSYQLPAIIGTNEVFVGFTPEYKVIFPEGPSDQSTDHSHRVQVEAGQHVENIDFQLQPTQFNPPVLPQEGQGTADAIRKDMEDINGDASIDIFDLALIGSNFGKAIHRDAGEAFTGINPDVNGDSVVNIFDLVLVAGRFGERLLEGAPSPLMQTVDAKVEAIPLNRGRSTARIALRLESNVDVFGVQFDLALHSDRVKLIAVEKGNLLGTSNHQSFWRSPEIQGNVATCAANAALLNAQADAKTAVSHTKVHLPGALAVIAVQLDGTTFKDSFDVLIDNLILVNADGRGVLAKTPPIRLNAETLLLPTHNRLMQNYPNPFNPETWIPYQISRDARVRLEFFTPSGQAVRTLDLGYRPAGLYVSRGRAAYWDGTNNFGERVASGVYFYTIQAENYHAIKRMVLMK